MIPGINDVFTLTGIAQRLTKAGALVLNDKGKKAQDAGLRVVLADPYIFHRGRYVTSVLRMDPNAIPLENYDAIGSLSVNSGMSHILPDVHTGHTSYQAIADLYQERGMPTPRFAYLDDVLRDLGRGNYDIVTAGSLFKALVAGRFVQLNTDNFSKL